MSARLSPAGLFSAVTSSIRALSEVCRSTPTAEQPEQRPQGVKPMQGLRVRRTKLTPQDSWQPRCARNKADGFKA